MLSIVIFIFWLDLHFFFLLFESPQVFIVQFLLVFLVLVIIVILFVIFPFDNSF